MSKTEAPAVDILKMCIAKIATCESLSGLSQLTYHVGYVAGSQSIKLRLWQNSGGGRFNSDWITLDDIDTTLAALPQNKAFLAVALAPLYPGKSTNSHAFLGACLLAEGLICRTEPGARNYMRCDMAPWRKEIGKLIASHTNLAVPPIAPMAANPESSSVQGGKQSARKPKPATAAANAAA